MSKQWPLASDSTWEGRYQKPGEMERRECSDAVEPYGVQLKPSMTQPNPIVLTTPNCSGRLLWVCLSVLDLKCRADCNPWVMGHCHHPSTEGASCFIFFHSSLPPQADTLRCSVYVPAHVCTLEKHMQCYFMSCVFIYINGIRLEISFPDILYQTLHFQKNYPGSALEPVHSFCWLPSTLQCTFLTFSLPILLETDI